VQANFMQLPFPNDSFDGVYAIEATCHAPKREGVYGEIYRVLKPGQIFATYEWCLTPKYDKVRVISEGLTIAPLTLCHLFQYQNVLISIHEVCMYICTYVFT
jgi:ubiquinone/menaquinone biosynthesis C-methylase UbiE